MTAISSDCMPSIALDHHGPLGRNSIASQTTATSHHRRGSRVCVNAATPARNSQCAQISKPLGNQMPSSIWPLERSRASTQPTAMMANPPLHSSSERSRTLPHSAARYSAEAAAMAVVRTSRVKGSRTMDDEDIGAGRPHAIAAGQGAMRSEEHTSELQSQSNLVCRLLLEKKKKK